MISEKLEQAETQELLSRMGTIEMPVHPTDERPSVAEVAEATGYPASQLAFELERMRLEKRVSNLEQHLSMVSSIQSRSYHEIEHNNFKLILEFISNPGPAVTVLVGCLGAALIIYAFWAGIHLVQR